MELIRVVKRGLKEEGEGPADKYVKEMLINKVCELDVVDKKEIIKKIQETYDSNVIVNSLELIDEGCIDEGLAVYLN